jgi:ubiquinone/menaquinone biosynthesis C-methylase UbiE
MGLLPGGGRCARGRGRNGAQSRQVPPDGVRLVGIDLSPAMLDLAKARARLFNVR